MVQISEWIKTRHLGLISKRFNIKKIVEIYGATEAVGMTVNVWKSDDR